MELPLIVNGNNKREQQHDCLPGQCVERGLYHANEFVLLKGYMLFFLPSLMSLLRLFCWFSVFFFFFFSFLFAPLFLLLDHVFSN